MTTATLLTRTGTAKPIRLHDPVWDTLEGRRVRFSRLIGASAVEVCGDDGEPLPDWRHPSQLYAY
jgi:hypothetical protein